MRRFLSNYFDLLFSVVQTEKQSLRSQCEALQQEQVISNEENSRLALRTHELEKENAALRGRTEEAVHRGKLDASNVRVEMLRERGDIERERDRLHSQLQGFHSYATSDPVSTRMGDRLWTGKPFWYVTSQLGQLSLSSLRGR